MCVSSDNYKVNCLGMKVKGAVRRVVLRGEVVCIDGVVIAKPGYGKHLMPTRPTGQAVSSTAPKV